MNELIKDDNLIRFILRERFLTITVIGSIFTFGFIGSFKNDIIEPIFKFIFPDENFEFMNVTLRENPTSKTMLRLGNFFRELIIFSIVVFILYLLHKYTKFPDQRTGNITGAAVL
jgi:large-conductance mechanosensitive channel